MTRAERKQATQVALRRAAVRLMSERGYEATPTDDIARAAGVSPRTFFNYFPTKESVVMLPEEFLSDLALAALRRRPMGEDVGASLAAAAVDVATAVAAFEADAGDPVVLSGVRLIFSERPLRAIFLERRHALEGTVWAALRERGVAATDVAARAAVATVVALVYLALEAWADGEGKEPLPAVVARYLLAAPDPARFAAGVTAPVAPHE